MGIKRDELIALLDHNNPSPSLIYWNSILYFFEQNKQYLDLHDMEIICTESEYCRNFWNKDRTIIVTINKNGKQIPQENVIPSLNISKDDVNPKIYDHLESMRQAEKAKEKKKKQKITTPEPILGDIPLVATA